VTSAPSSQAPAAGYAARPIEEVLAVTRRRLLRVTPAEACQAMREGALLADIRTQAQRAAQGLVPGALHVERNVLEWRFDPRSPSRLAQVSGYDQRIILMCVEGYASSLAAASLQELGLAGATDLAGGFMAWAAAGLPVTSGDGGP
jgi:rhodanese-related sulfurtransferase